MKNWLFSLCVLTILLGCPINGIADTHGTMNENGVFVPDSSPFDLTHPPTVSAVTAVPAIPIPSEGAPWWAGIIATIMTALLGALTWLSKQASSFIKKKLEEVKTKENDKWYSMAFNLAGIAVKYAETKFGPDTATGQEKREEAIDWLMARLKAIDPNINSHIDRKEVAAFVDAAYHDIFTALSPLAPGQVTKPLIPPGV